MVQINQPLGTFSQGKVEGKKKRNGRNEREGKRKKGCVGERQGREGRRKGREME